jgi:HEAT repeat protein
MPHDTGAEERNPEADTKRVEALVRALQETHVSVVWNAERDLARLGYHARAAIPALNTLLSGNDPTSRLWARVALACITGDMDGYRSGILHDITSENSAVYPGMGTAAAVFLGKKLPEAIPFLLSELKADNADRRWCAANALGRMGNLASDALPILASLLKDIDEKVRWYAAWAIGEIGACNTDAEQEIVDSLAAALNDFDDDVRGYAAIALGRFGGQRAANFVSKINEMRQDPNPAIRDAADLALRSLNGSLHDN